MYIRKIGKAVFYPFKEMFSLSGYFSLMKENAPTTGRLPEIFAGAALRGAHSMSASVSFVWPT